MVWRKIDWSIEIVEKVSHFSFTAKTTWHLILVWTESCCLLLHSDFPNRQPWHVRGVNIITIELYVKSAVAESSVVGSKFQWYHSVHTAYSIQNGAAAQRSGINDLKTWLYSSTIDFSMRKVHTINSRYQYLICWQEM